MWCNGSTIDFGSISSGSNPDISTCNIKNFIIMKVFRCRVQVSYGAGLILVAANNIQQAFETFQKWDKDGYFDHDDVYPFNKWEEVEHLTYSVLTPKVIMESSYWE